ncbi:MAG: sigma-54 dependent transcriptional regulator [Oligoflexia bacterium]|nr:sigma-54 dependent transcriptional regulator [Oligoflexia bacterium]
MSTPAGTQHFDIALALESDDARARIQAQLAKHGLSVQLIANPKLLTNLKHEPAVIVLDTNLAAELDLGTLLKNNKTAQIITCGPLPTHTTSALGNSTQVWNLRSLEDGEALAMLVAKACVMHELAVRAAELEHIFSAGITTPQFQFRSVAMRELMTRIKQTAKRDSTVILRGETGTGKTTIAHMIHDLSERKNGPFVTLSCAALPKELLEAELFGYERGAFTGATQSRPGCAELAHGGTLFLDEIGDLPFELQPKLLTFLQERWVRRIGGRDVKHPDVRIISATHRDLRQMVQEGTFREDLLYRLEVLDMLVPPLRERKEDIRIICDYFLKQSAERRGESPKALSPQAQSKLESHDWPGNVRELQNVLERALAYAVGQTIEAEDCQLQTRSKKLDGTPTILAGMSLREIERRAIRETLEHTQGDKVAAAKMLGISLKSIYNKLKPS